MTARRRLDSQTFGQGQRAVGAHDERAGTADFAVQAPGQGTGIGLLLMLVLGMGGIYGGLVHEATLLVDRLDADL